jgi:hypothetical protein
MQSGLHARFRNSENGRDFFHAQMLNVPKNEHITVIRAEGIDGVLNGFPDFTLFEQLGRYRAPVSIVSRPIISFFVLPLTVDRLVEVPAGLLQFHPGFIIGNLQQPGAEL